MDQRVEFLYVGLGISHKRCEIVNLARKESNCGNGLDRDHLNEVEQHGQTVLLVDLRSIDRSRVDAVIVLAVEQSICNGRGDRLLDQDPQHLCGLLIATWHRKILESTAMDICHRKASEFASDFPRNALRVVYCEDGNETVTLCSHQHI